MYECEGMLWKRKPGATSTFNEFLSAQATLRTLWKERDWNPWDADKHEAREKAAIAIHEQWMRAEPGFRQWTEQELEAHLAEVGRECAVRAEEKAARQKLGKLQHDSAREQARLALLEQESILRHLRCRDYRVPKRTLPRVERVPARRQDQVARGRRYS